VRAGRQVPTARVVALVAALVAGLGLPVSGTAQETARESAPPDVPGVTRAGAAAAPLTLAEAIRLAERNNPVYRQTVNDLELNRLDRSDAWLTLLPTPQVTALSTGLSWNLQTLGTDNFGNPIGNPEARMIQSSTSTQRFGLGFQVDLRNVLNLRQQETQATLRDITALTQLRGLRSDVTRAFLDAQERQVSLALEEELLATAEQNLELTRRLFQLARRDRMDLLSAELDLADRESQLESARTDLRAALLALRNLIGDEELVELELAPEEIRVFDPAGLDDEALVEEALRGSPRIDQARASIESASRSVSTQRAQWLPTLNLSMNTARQEFERGGSSAFLSPLPEGDWSRNVAIQLSFPDLGQYFSIRNSTSRSRIQVRNQEEAMRQTRLELEQEVRNLVQELRQTERNLRLQERRAELAEERRDLQFQAYGLGRGSYLELQNASEQAAGARRSALQAGYAFERARISLERALGRPLTAAELGG
jgi:outer membrane protein